MAACCGHDGHDEALEQAQRWVLRIALALNAGMFVAECISGWLAESTALLADSLDMLADAAVYAMSLYAVGRAMHLKTRAARANGSLQLLLGLMVLADVGRRFLLGSAPEPLVMGVLGTLALAVNTTCFILLARFRRGDINLRATWLCSRNDMLANLGVLAGAALVSWQGKAWPDLLIGLVIAALVIHSAWQILRETAEKAGS